MKGANDLATKIYINSFAMAAEIESDLISQRTKNGLARVKAEGKKLGNPNLKADNRKTHRKSEMRLPRICAARSRVLSKTAAHNAKLSMNSTESVSRR